MGAVSAVTWLSQSDSQSQAAVAVAAAAAVLEGFGTKAATSSSRSSMLHASFSCTVNLNSILWGKPD